MSFKKTNLKGLIIEGLLINFQLFTLFDSGKFKPGFIEIECYRFFGHARMDKSPYRNDSEETEMRKLDPINYARTELIKNKISQNPKGKNNCSKATYEGLL